MSYTYRKSKRMCAHWILDQLDIASLEFVDPSKSYFTGVDSKIRLVDLLKYERYDLETMKSSMSELEKNRHIRVDIPESNIDSISIILTDLGLEAFLISFYLVENRKDFL